MKIDLILSDDAFNLMPYPKPIEIYAKMKSRDTFYHTFNQHNIQSILKSMTSM